jgi:glycosyltransferase involved in cell wall biosynthesis
MNPHARLDSLRQNPHIEITGAVPDPAPYLHAANVYIIPMRVGGGTRFKALEAMASAKAIVSTTLGVEGIGVHPEKEMLIADSPDEFAVAILRLIADQRADGALSQQLGQNAYTFVSAYYVWDRIIPVFERLYTQLRPGPNTPRPLAPSVPPNLPTRSGTHHDQTGVNP